MATKRKDPVGLRTQRIQKMHAMIRGVGDVDLKRFTATCSYQMGLTRERVLEYLRVLVDLGFIELEVDMSAEGYEIAGIIREVKKVD